MKLKKAGLATKIVVTVLVIYAIVSLIGVHSQIENAKADKKALAEQAETLEIENAAMKYALENSEDDDVKAKIARDKLDLVFPDEEVFTEN